MAIKDFPNLYSMLRETVEEHGDAAAYRWFVGGGTESVTWNQFLDEVHGVAKSLVALGVEKGDKVNILSYTCYRWVLTDFAVSAIGGVTVGIYHSNLAEDCRYIVDHSDAVLVFAEDDEQLAKLSEIRGEIPDVKKVVLFSGTVPDGDDWVLSFDDFLALGAGVDDGEIARRAAAVTPDDLAGIVYTSGTTGVPKGAMLTHDNVVFTPQSVVGSISYHDGDECFLFLPLAHVFARTCVYAVMRAGLALTFARGMDTVAADLRAARPHWFPSVPRIYEKVYAKVLAGAQAKGGLALQIFNWACAVGDRVSDLRLAKRPIPFLLGLQYGLAGKLVFSKLQAALGGRVRWCISGAAPLNPAIAKFFHAADILILEGIGMTENTSFSNINRLDNYRFGWVGPPGPGGIEQKVAADGEVLYRGRNVMLGYYKMPEETAETIDGDGWLSTGDLGEIDEENFLRITGRKKDLIITAGGKNIAPSAIEGLMATAPHINQVCVIGDRRKFLSALVTLDPEAMAEWAAERGLDPDPAALQQNPEVVAMIEAEVQEKNRELASYETLKKIILVDEFTIENGMLTPTMKVKRNVAMEHYADAIEAMYPD